MTITMESIAGGDVVPLPADDAGQRAACVEAIRTTIGSLRTRGAQPASIIAALAISSGAVLDRLPAQERREALSTF